MGQKYDTCQNCGTALQGEYCHECGQRANEPRRAVIGLVQDVFVDTLWIDGRLLRSIGMLLWRPGRLARRYLDGKRQRYTPPFRLFLFASVFFFFFVFLLIGNGGGDDFMEGFRDGYTGGETVDVSQMSDEERASLEEARQALDEAGLDIPLPGDAAPAEEAPTETGDENEQDAEEPSGFWNGAEEWDDEAYDGPEWARPIAKQLTEASQRVAEDPRLFLQSVRVNLPRVMLLAPFFYALILALLYVYRWRKFLFYDHLIVSLYMHAALYAYLLIMMLLDHIPIVGWLNIFIFLWAALQPYAVFRQAYGSNWVSVVMKGVISTTLYAVFVVLLITFGLSYSLYLS